MPGLEVGLPTSAAGLKSFLDLDEVVIWTSGELVPASTGQKFPGRPQILSAVISGGVAGNHTVTGIRVESASALGGGDDLVSVIRHIGAGTAVTDISDLTSEFTITADSTINNTGGTNTTGSKLQVLYSRSRGYDLTGLSFPANLDTKAAMTMWVPASWSTATIGIVSLATSFGSGNVRWYQNGDAGTVVTVAVAAAYVGTLFADVALTAGSGAMAGFKFKQFALTRQGSHASDTLEEGIVPLCLYAIPGA